MAKFKIKHTITKKEWNKKHKDFKSMIDGVPYIMMYDDKTGTHLVPVKIVDESVNEESYKVAGRPVTLIKGKKANGTDWKVKFQNGKETSLSDVLSLIKPFPKGIRESVNEGNFGEIDIMAREARNFNEFVKEFYKDFRDFPKDKDTVKWLKSLYDGRSND